MKLIIWGAGEHAQVVADIVRRRRDYELVGWIDDVDPTRHGTVMDGAPILGGRDQLERLRADGVEHVAVGIGRCEARLRLAEVARAVGYRLPTLIHPAAIINTELPIGEGTVIRAGAVVDVGTTIGALVAIGPAVISHHCAIGDGALIGPGTTLGGGVHVGRGTLIGIGASVAPHARIGAGTLVGAGAVVLRDLPDRVLAHGVPARVVRPIRDADGP